MKENWTTFKKRVDKTDKANPGEIIKQYQDSYCMKISETSTTSWNSNLITLHGTYFPHLFFLFVTTKYEDITSSGYVTQLFGKRPTRKIELNKPSAFPLQPLPTIHVALSTATREAMGKRWSWYKKNESIKLTRALDVCYLPVHFCCIIHNFQVESVLRVLIFLYW